MASPLLTLVDDGRRPRGLGSRPFDGEGLPTRRNVPLENGVAPPLPVRLVLGAQDRRAARRAARAAASAAGPRVGAGNLYFAAGRRRRPSRSWARWSAASTSPTSSASASTSSPATTRRARSGHWIEKGRLVHPVHEVTIAGNLKQMLLDVDAVGNDLVWRSSSASPTLRIRRMTVSGS